MNLVRPEIRRSLHRSFDIIMPHIRRKQKLPPSLPLPSAAATCPGGEMLASDAAGESSFVPSFVRTELEVDSDPFSARTLNFTIVSA